MAKYKDVQELFDAIRSGQATPDDFKAFMKAGYSANHDLPKDLVDKYTAGWEKQLTPALQAAGNTPAMQQYAKDMLKQQSGDRFVKNFKPFFNAMVQGADIVTSLSQIQQGNKALANMAQPSIPASPGIPQELAGQLYNAQRGSFDSQRAIAPIRQALNDKYNTDINAAKQISNGQSGQFGSLQQAASNERLRGSGGLATVADQIRAREQARADQLLGMKANLAQQDFSNRMWAVPTQFDQYNRNVQAAAGLTQQGNINLRNVFQTLPENLLGAYGRAVAPEPPTPTTYTPGDIVGYHDQLQNSLQNIARQQATHLPTQFVGPRNAPPRYKPAPIQEVPVSPFYTTQQDFYNQYPTN